MATKITGQLKTPVDANGNRTDIHLINTTDEVLMRDGSTLTEKIEALSESTVYIGTSRPTRSCIWFDTTAT